MKRSRPSARRISSVRHSAGQSRICCRPQAWELREARDSRACHDDHLHDLLSIGQILEGETSCRFAGRTQILRAGDVVCFPAYAVHSCNPKLDQKWSFRMLYLDAYWLEMHQVQPPTDAGLACDWRMAVRCYNRLAQAIWQSHDAATDRPGSLRVDALLLELLRSLSIDPWDDWREPASQATARMIQMASDYLCEHACDPIGLAELAAAAGCSAWQLLRGFQREMKVTPHAMQQSLRVQQARRWLQQGMPLADAALQAGFADQSHFTHVFRRYTSLTPGRYQRIAQAT